MRLSRVAVVPGHAAPAQAFCDAYFARHPVVVWKAARGVGGKSFMLAALSWMEALTLHANVSVLGGSGQQSQRVHDYMRKFWMRAEAPSTALQSDPSRRETRLMWGNVVEVQNASQASVRGFHGARLRIDEADEVEWAIAEAARGQAMDQEGVQSNVVFSSTHQHGDGTMTKLLQEAYEKNWGVYEWSWHENMEPHGWLSEGAKERYKQTVSAELWRVEVELGEPSPEGRAVDADAVEAMFQGPMVPDKPWEMCEVEPPIPGAVYASGADWAKEIDFSVFWTWRCDVRPVRLVCYQRGNRRPYPWMVERFMEQLRRYPGDAYHDVLGVGTAVADLFSEPVESYAMQGAKRDDLWMDYITAIERGDVTAVRLATAYNAHKYVRNIDLYTARKDIQITAVTTGSRPHPPDPFVAAAMAWQAAQMAMHPVGLVNTQRARAPDGRTRTPGQPTPQGGYLAGLIRRPADGSKV